MICPCDKNMTKSLKTERFQLTWSFKKIFFFLNQRMTNNLKMLQNHCDEK